MSKIKATRHEIPTPVHFWTAFMRQDTCFSCAFNFCMAAIRHFLHCVQFIVSCICKQSCFASWQAIRLLLAKNISNQSRSAWQTKDLFSAVQRKNHSFPAWHPSISYKQKTFLSCMANKNQNLKTGGLLDPDPDPSIQGFGSVSGSGSALHLSCWIRIRIRIQIADPDPGGQNLPKTIEKRTEFSSFEVLVVLFRGLKASPVAWASFMEA